MMILGFLGITHAVISTTTIVLFFHTTQPLILLWGILGSQLPDIDTTSSYIGRLFFPLAAWFEGKFPHRTITHSLLATGFLALLVLPLYYLTGRSIYVFVLPFGHLISSIADVFTKQGVQLLWPWPTWCISPEDPRRRVSTGGPVEYAILIVATFCLLFTLWSVNQGGIGWVLGQKMGFQETWHDIYNQHAFNHQVRAEFKGIRESDRSSIEGNYLIIDTEGSELILSDGEAVYKTGEQIIPDSLEVKIGNPATTSVRSLDFYEDEIYTPLLELRQRYPEAGIWLTGELEVDSIEEIRPFSGADRFPSLAITGSRVKLTYHPIASALEDLRDQYGSGSLQVKIIDPADK